MSVEKDHSLENLRSGRVELSNIMHRRRKNKGFAPALGSNNYYRGDSATLPVLEDDKRDSVRAPPSAGQSASFFLNKK